MKLGIGFNQIINIDKALNGVNNELFGANYVDDKDSETLLTLLYESNLLFKQTPINNIVEQIRNLRDNHEICIILERNQDSGFRVKEFLEKNNIPFDNLLCTNNQPLNRILNKQKINLVKL